MRIDKITRTGIQITALGIAALKAQLTMARSSRTANVRSAICSRRFSSRKEPFCYWQVTNLAAPRMATTHAYCQGNEISRLHWEKINERGQALTNFVRTPAKLKNSFSTLRRGRFLKPDLNEALQVKEITWMNAPGDEMQPSDWNDGNMRCFGMLLDGRAQSTGIKRIASDPTLLLVMNAYHEAVNFKIPAVAGGNRWRCFIDTNDPDREELSLISTGEEYQATGRSLLVFVLDDKGETIRTVRQLALDLSRSKQLAR
jgi:pullulanase/glycogen debranching enzyme